ncbi:hypothetical protein [Streptomyces mangrovisoli]|uniref:Uncharacterized protein n=1 Tax=Streptomyces mangrovisoli TaxID=1428628 RepID=A0A1J4NRT4_9ACTN|nr:hypothetical protein [Streptomyces mangrovisoli]OIJ65161.1 hypothetical protein WN71_025480 [Streptomyces mangrovisoli]
MSTPNTPPRNGDAPQPDLWRSLGSPASAAAPASAPAPATQRPAMGGGLLRSADPAAWTVPAQPTAPPRSAPPAGPGGASPATAGGAQAPSPSPWAAGGGAPTPSPWAATARPRQERRTSRQRQVVEGLPDWEPLPPGETVVRRPGAAT